MNKKNEILKYSNPILAEKKAKEYLGENTKLFLSTRKDKKYMVLNPNNNKWIHFGQMGYEDHTKHNNYIRKNAYLSRATKIKGEWAKDPFSPNNLSINILW